MKTGIVILMAGALASACAARSERLAKCSSRDNPIAANAYLQPLPPAGAPFALQPGRLTGDGCGPMRPVNPPRFASAPRRTAP
ncbi:hypothetical protein EV217_5324 [Phyllobacterium myrsinacearum]|uniref:hypothetical protein n=1 Tax=Phyllobacterium myrsinacearum TaxID=28101 RepID=UPI001028E1DA|nr:hypothetical protein [Phyllobacterium myrsinacearum]RZS70622.1 hypothetical protein EV217_5324 [Phyllobacterium myrsinacearum]